MLDSFLTFINQHTPDLKHQPTLLAVSGGMDSVAMADLFYKLGLPAAIAHCNFGLRGQESDDDEGFVKELAHLYGFSFFVTKLDTKAVTRGASVSTQMAARELRYEWFENIRAEHGYHWIATAHHSNDSLETVLLNLTRGTGLPGLTGIAPVHGNIIRPLIYASRREVGQYITENGILWREDRSNATDDYSRNKLRHHVMPVLSDLNPSLERTFNASAERLRAANRLLDGYLQSWKSTAMQREGRFIKIAREEITAQSEPVYRLWVILEEFGFQYSQMQRILNAFDGIPGKQFFSPSHKILLDRQYLILTSMGEGVAHDYLIIEAPEGIFLWHNLELRIQSYPLGAPFHFDQSTIAVDADTLSFPLTLRKWQTGDSFQPFGMQGRRKKVSDLLIDHKIDRFRKEGIAVLQNGNGDIVWIAGIRADERFRVTSSTQKILLLTVSTH